MTAIDPARHWFGGKMTRASFWRLRMHCTCGWQTRPFWNPDRAADELLCHQVFASIGQEDREEDHDPGS